MTPPHAVPASTAADARAGSAARAVTLAPGEGESFVIIGGGVRMLLDGDASAGRCCVLEAPVPPGEGPPLHSHEREDELFYVLDGRFKFQIDGRVFIGERGSFAYAPRGSVHSFRNIGSGVGTLLVTCTPAGIEGPFRAIRVPEAGSGLAPMSIEQIAAELAKHGIAIHGPPLSAE